MAAGGAFDVALQPFGGGLDVGEGQGHGRALKARNLQTAVRGRDEAKREAPVAAGRLLC